MQTLGFRMMHIYNFIIIIYVYIYECYFCLVLEQFCELGVVGTHPIIFAQLQMPCSGRHVFVSWQGRRIYVWSVFEHRTSDLNLEVWRTIHLIPCMGRSTVQVSHVEDTIVRETFPSMYMPSPYVYIYTRYYTMKYYVYRYIYIFFDFYKYVYLFFIFTCIYTVDI